jgi:DNA repair exonuclease SbcCD ATPase subunit
MQLTAADRRAVIEDILDIGIFSEMNVVLKEKTSQMKTRQQTLENKLEVLLEKERVVGNYISNLEKMQKDTDDEKKEKINQYNTNIINLTEEKNTLLHECTDLETDTKNISTAEKNIISINNIISRLEENLNKLNKDINYFDKNHVCETCQQTISSEIKIKCIDEKTKKKTEIESGIQKAKDSLKKYTQDLEFSKEQNKKLLSSKFKISSIEDRILNIKKEIEKIESSNKSGSIDIDKEKENLNKILADKKKIKIELEKIKDEDEYMDIIGGLLKDSGIKAKIIKHYLPIINKLINKYLSSMDFFVKFNLDEEFNETIKSRHRDDFSYSSFSEGEKMRIDLSLLLCWREIARMKNSVSCNLLILDEVFDSSLDSGGTEEFMKLLQSLGKNSNIFVISHKTDQLIDKFSTIISFEKRNNFSKICVS